MDKRIYELQDGSSNYQTVFTNLGTVIDSSDISDAKFLKLSTLIKSDRVVSTDSANNYKALSPKSFLESVATENHQGIIRYATDAEVLNLSGDNAIQASQINLLWSAISSAGRFDNGWAIDRGGVPSTYCDFTNIYFSGQENIVHLNGYIIIKPQANPMTKISNYINFDFTTIGAPISGSVSSVNCYWNTLSGDKPTNLIGYVQNSGGNLNIYITTGGANWGTLTKNIAIYFQVSYITRI